MIEISGFLAVLQSFGISLSAGAFIEYLKATFANGNKQDLKEFTNSLKSFLELKGMNVEASTIIEAFAHEGLLNIEGTKLYAPDSISMGTFGEAIFIFGNNSVSETSKSKIEANGPASMTGKNSGVVQNPDGSISFHVGSSEGSHLSFNTGKKKD